MEGLYTWLAKRANHVFGTLTSDQTEGKLGVMRYKFEFAAEAPVLVSVRL